MAKPVQPWLRLVVEPMLEVVHNAACTSVLRYAARAMDAPRFVVESMEELVALARCADPPVEIGEIAEVKLPARRVRMRVSTTDPLVVWDEVR